MGYLREKYSVDADGDIALSHETAFLFPVDPTTVSRSDSGDTFWSTPEGNVINGNSYAVENGELESKFFLSSKDDKWQVSGELQGKSIETTLEHNAPILSDYGSYLKIAELLKSDESNTSFTMWTTDVDPTSVVEMQLDKLKEDPSANIQMQLGPVTMKFLVDEHGIMQSGTLSQGPVDMTMSLLNVIGTPVKP